MRIWLALLAAPILMLADQSIAYGTAGWSCAEQNRIALHAVHAVFFAATAVFTWMAWRRWRGSVPAPQGDEAVAARHFLAGIAMASGAFSTLVIAAMWLPNWVLSPCFN